MIVSSHCVSGAEQKGSQETWKNITFGLRGRTSRQHSNHTDTHFKKGGLWGSNEMTVAILITTSRPSVCDAIVWQAQQMRYRGIGQRSRKIEGKRKKDDLRSQIPEGAVRQTESRGNAIDSDAKPLITEFLGGHRGELCLFTGKVCSVY